MFTHGATPLEKSIAETVASRLSPGATINGVLFTGASNIVVTAAAGTLTGTTMAANVVTSSLTTVGTLASLDVTGATTLSSNATVEGASQGSVVVRKAGGNGMAIFSNGPDNAGFFLQNSGTLPLALAPTGIEVLNKVNTVSPTAPDRTVTMVCEGVTLYLHAKTTND